MRVVKVRKLSHMKNTSLDISKIVAISDPCEINRYGKTISYYDIYFDNVVWSVYEDSFKDVMKAWLNPDKECIPQDLTEFANTI